MKMVCSNMLFADKFVNSVFLINTIEKKSLCV